MTLLTSSYMFLPSSESRLLSEVEPSTHIESTSDLPQESLNYFVPWFYFIPLLAIGEGIVEKLKTQSYREAKSQRTKTGYARVKILQTTQLLLFSSISKEFQLKHIKWNSAAEATFARCSSSLMIIIIKNITFYIAIAKRIRVSI